MRRGRKGQEYLCVVSRGTLRPLPALGGALDRPTAVWLSGPYRRCSRWSTPLFPAAIYYPGTPSLSAVQHEAGAFLRGR
jgi:hypothetical protein